MICFKIFFVLILIYFGYLWCGYFFILDDSDFDIKVNIKLRYIYYDYIYVLERVIIDIKYNKIFVNNVKYFIIII